MKFSPLVTASAGLIFLTLSAAPSWGKMKTVVVMPGIPSGWVSSTGTARFEAAAAPMGAGALVLSVTETQQQSTFSTASFAGVWLRDLYSLQYTVQRTAPAAGTAAPLIELDIDFDLRDRSTAPQGKLVYDPAQNGTVTTGTWQTWNASAGKWYFTGGTAMAANAGAGQPFPQSTPATLREILTRFPNAGIRAAGGTLSLKADAWAGPFTAAVDSLTVTLRGGGITWNFEPDSDGDRVPDFIDRVPLSDLRTKVEMGLGPTTVNNSVDKNGMSIQDRVLSALLGSDTPAKYITSIAVLGTELQKAGAITPRQKDELRAMAGTFVSSVITVPAGGTIAGGTLHIGGGTTGGTTTVNVNTVGGTLSMGGGLVKTGAGTLSFTDSITMSSPSRDIGNLVIGSSLSTLRNNSPVVVNPGTIIAARTLSLGGWLAGSGPGTSVSPGTVVGGSITPGRPNGQPVVNLGTIVVDPSVVNPGNGILVLTGGTLTGTGTVTLTGAGTSGGLNSTSGLVKSGSGIMTLSSATTYTGTTTINGGTLILVASRSIGSGTVVVNNGGSFLLDTTSAGTPLTIANDLTIAAGGYLIIRGIHPVKFTGTITNNGTIRTERGATLDASTAAGIVNNGTLDRISGTMLLPAAMTSGPAARLLDPAAVQVRTAVREGSSFTLTIDGHSGHTYQLQRTTSLDQPFTNTGTPKTGAGTVLTLTSDDASAPRGFYRVAVDP